MRTLCLAALRSVWKIRIFERALVRITYGRSYSGFISKLPPLWTSYAPGSEIRSVVRHDIRFELDLSELGDWYLYWNFRNTVTDALLALSHPGMTVLDAGARIGTTALPTARAVGPTGHVHAVEPDPTNYRRLARHLALNPELKWVTLHNGAFSDQAGTLYLQNFIPHNRTPRVSAQGTPVRAIRIDDLGLHPDLVKIDVEGYEVKALASAGETLRHRPPLVIEINDILLREAGASAQKLLDALGRLGYRVQDVETGAEVMVTERQLDAVCTAEVCV